MFDNRVPKQIVGEYEGEMRPAGKPKNGWEVLKGAAKLLNTKNWRTAVRYKGDGRKKTEQKEKEKNENNKCVSIGQHFAPIFLAPSE
jgi:hypothetical protein